MVLFSSSAFSITIDLLMKKHVHVLFGTICVAKEIPMAFRNMLFKFPNHSFAGS
jgi:hypothetical protein